MATKRLMQQLIKMSPINVLGADFHLVLYPKRWQKVGTPGSVNFPMAKIHLDTSLDDNRLIEILFHEILEILVDRFTLKGLDHIGICALEFGLMDTFRSNLILRKLIGEVYTNEGNTYEFSDFEAKETKFEQQSPQKALKNLKKKTKKGKSKKKARERKDERVVAKDKRKG